MQCTSLVKMDHHLPQALNRVVTIKTRYIVVILSGMDFHLSQVLNRVVTIKTRCVVVVLSVMDLHLHQALNRVFTKKNKVHVCGFVCIGSPPFTYIVASV
jgi:2-hydroxy-3-keto-5-methylthiopentenyl-1-phosphate phosphatase